MPAEDAPARLTQRFGGLDELRALQLAGLVADDARHGQPRDAAHGQEDHREVLAEDDRGEDDDERQRQRAHDVDAAHQEVLGAAADFRREHAVADAEHEGHGGGDQADEERDHAALEQARKDVASEEVGAEPVRRRGRHGALREVLLHVRIRRDPRRQEADGRDRHEEPARPDGRAVPAEALPAALGGEDLGDGGAHRPRATLGFSAALARSAARLRRSSAAA